MELWTEVRRRVLTDELSKRAACREYELSWHTLAKILVHDEPPGYRKKQPRKKPKLEVFLPIIHQILEDDRMHRRSSGTRPGGSSSDSATNTALAAATRSSRMRCGPGGKAIGKYFYRCRIRRAKHKSISARRLSSSLAPRRRWRSS